MAVIEEDKEPSIPSHKPPVDGIPPDFPAECKDAAIAAGNDIVKSLNGLSTEKALNQPGAAEQSIADGAGKSILKLGECMQRAGKLPNKPAREGRPIS